MPYQFILQDIKTQNGVNNTINGKEGSNGTSNEVNMQ